MHILIKNVLGREEKNNKLCDKNKNNNNNIMKINYD